MSLTELLKMTKSSETRVIDNFPHSYRASKKEQGCSNAIGQPYSSLEAHREAHALMN
jgi:hypothetical protein